MEWGTYFDYKEGKLFWKVEKGIKAKVGQEAGYTSNTGYLILQFNYKSYMVHRVIYELLKGNIPKGYFIDHIDRNKSNNKIENLRLVTPKQNCYNSDARPNNKLGTKGVHYHKNKNKYQAQIKDNGVAIYLGQFDTPEEAKEAYEKAAKRLHGEFYNGPF
jgi:hypothetical protein